MGKGIAIFVGGVLSGATLITLAVASGIEKMATERLSTEETQAFMYLVDKMCNKVDESNTWKIAQSKIKEVK